MGPRSPSTAPLIGMTASYRRVAIIFSGRIEDA
jgi:hypothetical protein